jgi:hypothetical protein
MLFKLRCPHTGGINFFTDAEPAIAVGSIMQISPSQFIWRSYMEPKGGSARQVALAEARLNRAG